MMSEVEVYIDEQIKKLEKKLMKRIEEVQIAAVIDLDSFDKMIDKHAKKHVQKKFNGKKKSK